MRRNEKITLGLACAWFLVSGSGQRALAVSPLVTDDADTVERGNVQVNSGWQFSKDASVNRNSLYINPVLGVTPCGEFGTTFGYQWHDAAASANSVTDLILETKWRLAGKAEDKLKLSARFDLKLPTAPTQFGLGTGDLGAGTILIATYCHQKTSLDWNIGYIKVDVSRAAFNADQWFLGQAVRQQLNDKWMLIGETYTTIQQGDAGNSANLNFNTGIQYSLRQNFLFSFLIGSAIGHDSPDITGNFGCTWVF